MVLHDILFHNDKSLSVGRKTAAEDVSTNITAWKLTLLTIGGTSVNDLELETIQVHWDQDQASTEGDDRRDS